VRDCRGRVSRAWRAAGRALESASAGGVKPVTGISKGARHGTSTRQLAGNDAPGGRGERGRFGEPAGARGEPVGDPHSGEEPRRGRRTRPRPRGKGDAAGRGVSPVPEPRSRSPAAKSALTSPRGRASQSRPAASAARAHWSSAPPPVANETARPAGRRGAGGHHVCLMCAAIRRQSAHGKGRGGEICA